MQDNANPGLSAHAKEMPCSLSFVAAPGLTKIPSLCRLLSVAFALLLATVVALETSLRVLCLPVCLSVAHKVLCVLLRGWYLLW